ncbi:hypothetical protein [uncultured Oscillibacter sp.]|uniref:hypothetical protein n=1 Tax=uncultured Oscillibacter sp. TaxID=876091 RepID=UPI00272C93A2|nr:hypothetical protein [uncultured Oscillibacter sp.]
MTEIKYGAVLVAAAHKQGVEMNHDDATVVLSYFGLEDHYLMCSNDLSSLTLRHHLGGDEFDDKPCNILDAVKYVAGVCKGILDYTLEAKEKGYTKEAKFFRGELRTLKRLADTYAAALS